MSSSKSHLRAICYARVSTEEQGTDEHFSIEAQLNEMQEFAQRRGWEVIAQFIDMMSGTRRDRPQLEAALEMIKRRECDVLLVHELSRLSRSVLDTLDIFEILGKNDVMFASVKEADFDFTDPLKKPFLILIATFNEYYVTLLRLHTQKSKRQRAKDGLHNASIAPYGYVITQDSPRTPPQTVETEAAAVRLMFETYATGQHSDQAIADLLYAHGYLTRRGKRFTAATVADILRNPFYIGKAVYQRRHSKYNEIYEGTHEPLISQELWDRCQEVRAQRHSASRAVQKPFRIYLLGNLAHCSVCGRRLGGQPTPSGLYYREVSRTRGYDDCPHHSHSIRVEIADRQISAIVMAIRLPPDWQDALNAKVGEDEQLIYLRRQRAELERQRRRLKDMYLHGDFNEDAEMYRAELARIRAALEELPTYDQLENLRQAAATAQTLPELWPQASPEDQRDLLRLMLREVRVDVITGRVVSLRPQPVFIPIFREIALLDEREFGVFVPNWGEHPDADQILAIPRLPTLEAAPAAMQAAPFWATLPITGDENARIAPGLAEALRIGERTATTVTQVCLEGQVPLPDDLRKWEDARARSVTLPEWRALEASSTDVLVLRLGLWHHILHPEFDLDLHRLVSEASRVLRAGGVWYWVEVLPLEMPAHWVFRFFPAAWEWARLHSWTMHALNLKLLEAGLTTRMKNHVSYQPIQASAVLAIAERREGLLAHLSDEAYATGLTRLKQVIADKGDRYVLGSEVQCVEVWAQKR